VTLDYGDTALIRSWTLDYGDTALIRSWGLRRLSVRPGVGITAPALNSAAGYGVAQVQFADGATWSLAQLKALAQQAGAGNTALFGADANTRYSYAAGDGAVSIGDLTGSSTLTFASGIEPGQVSVSSPNGVDLVLALSATDIITIPYGYSGNDSVYAAGFGVANVTFADIPGTSWSLATLRAMAAANPTSFGAHATLGGSQPGAGPQTYSYAAGAGAVTLTDSTAPGLLQLGAGINPWDLGVSSNGTDLIVRVSATDSVTIAGGMIGGTDLRNIRFADGYVLGLAQLQSMALTATAANTTLNGPPTGGASFAYNQGAGAATINLVWTNWSAATLQLNGILPAGAEISSPNGQDLVLSFSATDSITIPSGYSELAQGRGIETITFADGTVWNAAHIEALLTGAVLATPGPASAAGAAAAAAAGADLSPVTRIAYDADGDEIAVTDADGNTTGQVWNADGELAEVTHADGGVIKYGYDAFGDQVQMTDAMGNTTQYAYDDLGRQTSIISAPVFVASVDRADDNNVSGTVESIVTTSVYDALGDKIEQIDGAGDITIYGYDLRGNQITTTDADGYITTSLYDDQGKQVSETDADGNTQLWNYNSFGQLETHNDLAATGTNGRLYTYTYDNAQQLRSVVASATGSVTQDTQTYTYDGAGQLLQFVDGGNGATVAAPNSSETTTYAYNAAGQHVLEETVQDQNGTVTTLQDQNLSYDTLGRLSEIDVANGGPDETIAYDAVGNKMQEVVTQANQATQDLYFAYNAMNQQVLADGAVDNNVWNLANITIAQGHVLGYDLNGNRISDESWGLQVAVPSGGGSFSTRSGLVTEVYTYDQLNRLSTISTTDIYSADWSTQLAPVNLDARYYDAASREIEDMPTHPGTVGADGYNYDNYIDALIGQGGNPNLPGKDGIVYGYDQDGRVLWEENYDLVEGTQNELVSYSYDHVGNVTGYTYAPPTDEIVTSSYVAHYVTDAGSGYKQTSVVGTDQGGSSDPVGTTTETYDADGNLVRVKDSGNSANDRVLSYDDDGEVLLKAQGANVLTDPTDGDTLANLIVNGAITATYGTGVDANDPANASGDPRITDQRDFDLSYQAVANDSPAPTSGQYQVQAGDSLQSIALAAYGDASLWYLIAQANGLSSDNDLSVGQSLIIPATVADVHNNAGTIMPYNGAKIIGSTTPTIPAPATAANNRDCGMIGQILVVIAAAAQYAASSPASAYEGMFAMLNWNPQTATPGQGLGFLIAGDTALGNLAGQEIDTQTGYQNSVNWTEVGAKAVQDAGRAAEALLAATGVGAPAAIALSIAIDAASQGLDMAIGAQKSFNWQEVAGTAIAAGVTAGVAQGLGADGSFGGAFEPGSPAGQFATNLVSGTVGGIVGGVSQAALSGGKIDLGGIAASSFNGALESSIEAPFLQDASDAFGNPIGSATSEEIAPDVPLATRDFGEGYDGGGGFGDIGGEGEAGDSAFNAYAMSPDDVSATGSNPMQSWDYVDGNGQAMHAVGYPDSSISIPQGTGLDGDIGPELPPSVTLTPADVPGSVSGASDLLKTLPSFSDQTSTLSTVFNAIAQVPRELNRINNAGVEGFVAAGGTSNFDVSPEYLERARASGLYNPPGQYSLVRSLNELVTRGPAQVFNLANHTVTGLYAGAAFEIQQGLNDSGITPPNDGSFVNAMALLPLVTFEGGLGPIGLEAPRAGRVRAPSLGAPDTETIDAEVARGIARNAVGADGVTQFSELSSGAKRLVTQLGSDMARVKIGQGVRVNDLRAASEYNGLEIAVVRDAQGNLHAIQGTRTGILKSQVLDDDQFLIHTHPVYNTIAPDHFETDIANATDRTEVIAHAPLNGPRVWA
jgi:YD repeat-containing protein